MTTSPPEILFLDRSDRGRLDVLGPDRAKFLHNLTTNDVKRLAVGRGQEAFVTSLQGKTLGFVTLLACDDRIVLRTDPGALPGLLPHLEKYGVFDEVTLSPSASFEFHLAGGGAEEVLRRAGGEPPDEGDLSHRTTRVGDVPVLAVREWPIGAAGLSLIGPAEAAGRVRDALHEPGRLQDLDPAASEAMRIEAGTPAFGRDVTADNLPQEVGRDARAISFVKGCYLGQETVARIDALGHVNRLLKGLIFPTGAAVPGPARPSKPTARPWARSRRRPSRRAGRPPWRWAISGPRTRHRAPRSGSSWPAGRPRRSSATCRCRPRTPEDMGRAPRLPRPAERLPTCGFDARAGQVVSYAT